MSVPRTMTTAVAANAAWYDASSASQPVTSGPTTAPRSPAIWKAATTVPPRPETTSPTTAAGATPRNAAAMP